VSQKGPFLTQKLKFENGNKLMPVNIYRNISGERENEEIAWLCPGEWELTPQIAALSEWLEQTGATLPPAEYVADVGFCWRRDASSGGPVIKPAGMRRMADLGMSLYLSEYAGFSDELEENHSLPLIQNVS
jgi:hypothetical protein